MTEEDVAVDSTSFSYKIVYRELVVVQRVTEKFDSMDGMRMMKKKRPDTRTFCVHLLVQMPPVVQ